MTTKTKRTNHKYTNISQAEADDMFIVYQSKAKNLSATARHFDKDRSCIRRYRDKFDWDKKCDQIDRAKVKAIEKKAVSDLEIIDEIQSKILKRIKEELGTPTYNNVGNPNFKFSVGDLVALMRLKLEIQGDLPTDGGSNIHADVINIVQNLSETDKEKLDASVASVLANTDWTANTRF